MPQVAALYRLSDRKQVKRKQDDEVDIPGQRKAVAAFLAERPDWRLVSEYEEKGVSAFKISADDRDVLQEAYRDAAAGKWTVLVVFKADRLSRRSLEYPGALAAFHGLGVEVWSVVDQPGGKRLSIDNQMDKLVRFIEGWQAETESVNTSIRVRERMRQLAESGRWIGGRVPFGYKLEAQIGDDGQPVIKGGRVVRVLVPDPDWAPTVREMYSKYLAGVGTPQLAAWLNKMGAPSFTGSGWEASGVMKLMRNPLYCGMLAYRRGQNATSRPRDHFVVRGVHEGIIDSDLWANVQEAMATRSRIPRRQLGAEYVLVGVAFCSCGNRIGGITRRWTLKSGEVHSYQEYRCREKTTRGVCPAGLNHHIRAEVLESAFVKALSMLGERRQLRAFLEEKDEDYRRRVIDFQEQQRALNERVGMVETGLKRLDRAYFMVENAVLTDEEYREKKQEFQAELLEIQNQLAALTPPTQRGTAERLAEATEDFVANWQYLGTAEKRAFALDIAQGFGIKVVVMPDGLVQLEWDGTI